MKRLLFLFMLLSINLMGANVLWFSVNPNASLISDNKFVSSVIDYSNINVVRVTANDSPLHLYWQMTDEYGNYLYDEVHNPRYGLEVIDDDTGESYYIDEAILRDGDWYGADWSPADLGNNVDDDIVIKMELGYVDLDDWDSIFEPIAYYETTLGQLWVDDHIGIGGLSEPTFTPWSPNEFWIPVPEPSILIMILSGICIFLLKRKFYKNKN